VPIARSAAKPRTRKTKAIAGMTAQAPRRPALARQPEPYHHGALREALLRAAEALLERDGLYGLTLRAAARGAGVSHAAPKHHFGDLSGLLSELAVVGFERLRVSLLTGVAEGQTAAERLDAIGRGYVAFAKSHPNLFLLMFRDDRLDLQRPSLREASRESFRVLAGAIGAKADDADRAELLSFAEAGRIAAAWSLVHGFSMLMIDGRWKGLLSQLPEGTNVDQLFELIVAIAPRQPA
jgi:AcrR family transcriptional regulator